MIRDCFEGEERGGRLWRSEREARDETEGMAFRVLTSDVSVVDLVARLEGSTLERRYLFSLSP